MEKVISQALLELAGEEGYRGNVRRLLEGHGKANIASDLAAKVLAWARSYQPTSGCDNGVEPYDIPGDLN